MPKRILMLHASSDLYGASKILITEAQTLKEQGHEVVAVLSDEGPLADALREVGVELRIIRLGILRRKYFNFTGLLNRARVLSKAYGQLKDLINEKKIDIVYSHTSAVLIGGLVARSLGKPHLWHVLEITEKPQWFFRVMSWVLNRYGDKVIVASESVKNHWKKHVHEARLDVIYYGVDAGEYKNLNGSLRKELGLAEETLIIGMVGRVHYWKGQDYFLRIASRILKDYPDAHFVMVGDVFPGYEYLYDVLDKIIKEENLSANVHDLGFRRDVPQLLAEMDIFVQPSTLPDPFPTVILEAMAAGKPVVATGLGGAKEMIVHGESGYLIPLAAEEEVARTMEPLLNSKTLRVEMGGKSRVRLETLFSLEAFKRNFGEYVNRFIQSHEANH